LKWSILLPRAPPAVAGRQSLCPDMASRAIESFSTRGTSTHYGSSHRRAAERIDEQMLAYMQTRAIPGPWAAGEHILVSVGAGPLSERLVRTARRQADRMGARWTAIYIETPAHYRLSKEAKEQLTRTLQLAEKLGAATVTLFGLNIATTVIDYAAGTILPVLLSGKHSVPGGRNMFLDLSLINSSITAEILISMLSAAVNIVLKKSETWISCSRYPPPGLSCLLRSCRCNYDYRWLVKSFISRQISPCSTSSPLW